MRVKNPSKISIRKKTHERRRFSENVGNKTNHSYVTHRKETASGKQTEAEKKKKKT